MLYRTETGIDSKGRRIRELQRGALLSARVWTWTSVTSPDRSIFDRVSHSSRTIRACANPGPAASRVLRPPITPAKPMLLPNKTSQICGANIKGRGNWAHPNRPRGFTKPCRAVLCCAVLCCAVPRETQPRCRIFLTTVFRRGECRRARGDAHDGLGVALTSRRSRMSAPCRVHAVSRETRLIVRGLIVRARQRRPFAVPPGH